MLRSVELSFPQKSSSHRSLEEFITRLRQDTSAIGTDRGTMCDYTQVNYHCGHKRFVVKAWCTRYQATLV